MKTDGLAWLGAEGLAIFRRTVDEDVLVEIARRHWSAWYAGDVSDLETGLVAYFSDPRGRTRAPNPLFDESWYCGQYPDVAIGIRQGRIASGYAHFVHEGVFEGRPFNPYIHRRMGWCTDPPPPLPLHAGESCDPDSLDDESRGFLERFPHVPAVVYYNGFGRFLGGTSPLVAAESPAPVAGPRTALLVLGMHRSGTSTLSAALVAAGCFLGSDIVMPSRSNPLGFWESRGISRTLDAILARAGSAWDDARPIRFADDRARADAVRDLAAILAAMFRRSPLFAIKDPRSCRLAEVWREALGAAGVSMKVVIPVRHPLEVAQSLATRDRFPLEKGLALWARHLLDTLRGTRGLPRTIVRYQDLLADGPREIERIGAAIGLPWPVPAAVRAARLADLIVPDLRHHRLPDDAPGVGGDLPWVGGLWRLVNEDRAGLDRHDEIDAIDRAFTCATGGAPAATGG